jgi:hypothetical protein
MFNKIQREYHTQCFRLFMEYFEQELQVSREKLDIAVGNEIFKLQGEARCLKDLLKIQEKREIKYTDKDGGFGEE